MRNRANLTLILLLVATLAGATVGYTQSGPAGRQQWEYHMVSWSKMGDAGMQQLGAQGWELVAAESSWYYFKRPK